MDPELVVKFVADLTEWSQGVKEAKEGVKSVTPEVQKASTAGKSFSDVYAKAAAIAGGVFVTAALAVAKAVSDANAKVEALDKSVRVSSGTQANYAQNLSSLTSVADKYKKSIFEIGAGFNDLARETRGTVNEGKNTEVIFDTLVSVSKKLDSSVDDTSKSFTGFIDKMKQGTVDSTGLSNELDKRLYEAFGKVAQKMGLTNDELNKVLKTSDAAVSSTLPKLAAELANSLGDIPQQDAHDLGESVAYAESKLTMLLDGLFQTTGAKSALAQGAEDAGSFLDALDKINRRHGLMAAGGAAIVKGATAVASALVPGVEFSSDPFGYQDSASQTAGLKNNKAYNNGQSIGWNQDPATNKYKLPSQITQKDIDVAAEGMKLRAAEEEKANQKRIADEKRLAGERKRALDEISRLEIEESNQRIKDELAASFSSIEAKYRTNNSDINTPGMAKPTGTDLNYDYGSDKFNKEFSKQTTGDGSAVNFDKTTAQIEGMTKAWWDEKNAKDASAKATNELGASMEELSKELNAIVQESSVNLFSGIAESIGELSVSTDGIENVGAKIAGIFGDMISQVGKAIIAYGLTMKGLQSALKASFKNPYVAIAVGAVAIAAGAALKASTTKKNNNAQNNFFTGGIAKGAHGVDNIPINVSNGEMILNNSQQGRLFGLLDGAYSGGSLQGSWSKSNRSSTSETGTLEAKIRGEDLAILVERGKRRMNRYN